MIRLSIAVLKNRKKSPTTTPLIILHGGPGGRVVGYLNDRYEELAQNRDIVFIDQRGCGTSEPQFSPELNQQILDVLAENLTPDQEISRRVQLAEKAKEKLISEHIDLNAYNSNEISADINDLATSLGYGSYDLWAASYGTHVALTMIKKFPTRVHSAILESPLPPNAKYFEDITSNFRKTLNKLFDKCANDPYCHDNYPELKDDFFAAIDSLQKNPLIIRTNDWQRFPAGVFVINAQDILLALQQSLYDRQLYTIFPMLVDLLKKRDASALKAFAENMANGMFRLDYGLYYSVICKECMPFNSLKAFEDSSRNFWGGVTFYKDEFNICKIWNASVPDSNDAKPVSANTPVLILSGELDPMATSAYGELAGKTLPKSYWYTFENTGHFIIGDNHAFDIIKKFLATPDKEPEPEHFVKTWPIFFVPVVHGHTGIVKLAPLLKPGGRNWPYTVWMIVVLLCSIASIIVLSKKMRGRSGSDQQGILRSLFPGLGIVSSSLIILFIFLLVMAILKTAAWNRMMLGFGLPLKYAAVLYLPYLILCLYFILLLQYPVAKKEKALKSAYFRFFILQSPFVAFLIYFSLFY
ncbi:MAG: alpha/beta fold hydrolase [Bacteroidetes bacterium]|nr:alpha/beta fold hydrolase [Bacteroidota bacterium]